MGAGGSKDAEDGGALVSGHERVAESVKHAQGVSGLRRSRGRLNDRTKESLRRQKLDFDQSSASHEAKSSKHLKINLRWGWCQWWPLTRPNPALSFCYHRSEYGNDHFLGPYAGTAWYRRKCPLLRGIGPANLANALIENLLC